ncbi:MAG TPA: electron transfer flavoprotein subunit alpha/FixB family protein [Desulfomonilaceae bacterium]|nr:electron transfer flavoprotein subunit alpha/FixB family protein [Desulfomonilaceae bacterium]
MTAGKVHEERSLDANGVLVVCETRGGQVVPASAALVAHYRNCDPLSRTTDAVSAMVFGPADNPGSILGQFGAGTVYSCPSDPNSCLPESVAQAVAVLVRGINVPVVAFAGSSWAADLAPRVAVELHAPLVSNCTGIQRGSTAGMSVVQSIQGGRLYQHALLSNRRFAVICWDPEALSRYRPEPDRSAELVQVHPISAPKSDRVKLLRVIEEDPEAVSLGEAETVIAFGRGMDPEDLPQLDELKSLLRGAMAGTRPMVDSGLLPFERQIGQTGTTVSPRLLVAWGISGANEFTIGMEEAQTIVAINKDPQARIFRFSDLGLVGNGKDVLAQLLRLLAQDDQDASHVKEKRS